MNLKLCDFGSAIITEKGHKFNHKDLVGTIRYMSPEKLAGKPHCLKQADLYASAVLLYMMVANGFPFGENKKEDMIYDLF